MAYNRKTWKNRSSQYPTRRRLAKVSESDLEMVVDVSREEGTISQTGDQFSASSMNDLEGRIEAAFNDIPDIPEGIIGDTDISEIADGTLTGAIAEHDEDIADLVTLTTNIQAKADASINNQAKDIEPGNTATSAHSKGDYIIYGSSKKFAEVLSNISVGDSLSNATGGNIKDITQGEVLTELNSNLSDFIEYANNINGSYWKFADGTLICARGINAPQETVNWTAFGQIFKADITVGSRSWAYTFKDIPYVVAQTIYPMASVESISADTYGISSISLTRATSYSSNYNINIIAIGRWK